MAISDAQRREQNYTGAVDLRYPEDLDVNNSPFMVFSTQRPVYDNVGTALRSNPTGRSATFYIPTGYNISDSIRYQSAQGGLVGYLIDRFADGSITDIAPEDITEVATQNVDALAATAAAGLGAVAGGIGGAAVGGFFTQAAITGEVQNRFRRAEGKTVNPREYMMFEAPDLRTFSFDFSMIPQSENEANDVIRIIRFFRLASYPELSATGYAYLFPDLFKITIGNNDSMIRIPEVACTGVEVTYNPNALSYFTRGNIPVQIDISLSFQEMKAITRADIEEGF